jgi:transposase
MSRRPDERWMHAEDDQLRAAAALGESIAAISKRLCRSEKGIRRRAEKLGIELASGQRFGSSPRRLAELGLKVKAR